MKIYKLLFLITLVFSTASCENEEFSRIEPDGDAITNFSFPEGDIFAPSKVVLTNRSKYGTSYTWEFPGGKAITQNGIQNTTTATGVTPDTIIYELPGTYKVTLKAQQDGRIDSITKQVVIKKMQPQIVVPQNILYLQEVEFGANVFKYPGQEVTYSWTFAGAQPTTSTAAKPKVTFATPGVHNVTLTINDGQETLTTTTQVTVLDELVKTLYFTDVKTGKLYKIRFTQRQPSQPIQLPVNVGVHPLGVSVFNDRVIISNAGLHVSFASAGVADGRIFSVDLSGQNEATITSATGDYQNDPFSSTVDDNGNVWWATRRNGLFSIPSSARDAAYPAARIRLAAANAGVSSVFGWLDGDVQVVDGKVWYSKHGSAGRGLYVFNPDGTFDRAIMPLKDVRLRSFAIDSKNNKIYFAVNFSGGGLDKGLYVSNLDGTNITLIDPLTDFSTQGGANEQTYVTDIALDNNPDDGSAGYIYYGYRDAEDVSSTGAVVGSGSKSGIKRYPIDGSRQPDFLVKGYIPYGLAIDHVKR